SLSAARNASSSSSRIVPANALSLSGRLSVTVVTDSLAVTAMDMTEFTLSVGGGLGGSEGSERGIPGSDYPERENLRRGDGHAETRRHRGGLSPSPLPPRLRVMR